MRTTAMILMKMLIMMIDGFSGTAENSMPPPTLLLLVAAIIHPSLIHSRSIRPAPPLRKTQPTKHVIIIISWDAPILQEIKVYLAHRLGALIDVLKAWLDHNPLDISCPVWKFIVEPLEEIPSHHIIAGYLLGKQMAMGLQKARRYQTKHKYKPI